MFPPDNLSQVAWLIYFNRAASARVEQRTKAARKSSLSPGCIKSSAVRRLCGLFGVGAGRVQTDAGGRWAESGNRQDHQRWHVERE